LKGLGGFWSEEDEGEDGAAGLGFEAREGEKRSWSWRGSIWLAEAKRKGDETKRLAGTELTWRTVTWVG
jgi:hypothetical protein